MTESSKSVKLPELDGFAKQQLSVLHDKRHVCRISLEGRERQLLASEASRALLLEALEGLRRGTDDDLCWCDVAIGSPMAKSHSKACVAAALAARPPGGGIVTERRFENKGDKVTVTEKDAQGREHVVEFTGHRAVMRAHQYYRLLDILNDEGTTMQ